MIQSFRAAIKMAFVDRYLEVYPDKEFNDKMFYKLMDMVDEAVHQGLVKSSDELNETAWKCSTDLMVLMHNTARTTQGLKRTTDKILETLEKGSPQVYKVSEFRNGVRILENELDKYYVAVREKLGKENI